MAVYIQCDKRGLPASHNFFTAYEGFKELGAEMYFFTDADELIQAKPEDIIIGFVQMVRYQLQQLSIPIKEVDYPEELYPYLGRRIWRSTINEVNTHPEQWPVFVKSVEDKFFTGVLVRSAGDLIGCGEVDQDVEVLCSEPVEFVTEWRCFVRYGRILDVRHYKGDWRKFLDVHIVEQAVRNFTSAPHGYAIDFGLTNEGQTLLVEVNDGYALGAYGLFHIDYAKLLAARWAELTGTEDEYNF